MACRRARSRALIDEFPTLIVDLLVSATTIEARPDRDEARRMMVTVIWMIESKCYMNVVHDADESDDRLAQRVGDEYLRAFGVK